MHRASLLVVLLLACAPAFSEMEKVATQCGSEICFHWWPKLPAVSGWHHDREHSLHYSFNAQAPDGKTFANAEAVIYANAPYKARMPEVKSLQTLIDNDQRQFRTDFPGVKVRELDPILTAEGKPLRSFEYTPAKAGNWERVSYGEDSEFYLIFTVSSRTMTGLARALGAYEEFIHAYKVGP